MEESRESRGAVESAHVNRGNKCLVEPANVAINCNDIVKPLSDTAMRKYLQEDLGKAGFTGTLIGAVLGGLTSYVLQKNSLAATKTLRSALCRTQGRHGHTYRAYASMG